MTSKATSAVIKDMNRNHDDLETIRLQCFPHNSAHNIMVERVWCFGMGFALGLMVLACVIL